MTNTQPESTEVKRPPYRTSLARSLIRTLMIFTFIPFIAMAGVAYWRASTLFSDQITVQMQNQMTAQLNQLDLIIKAKQIRLDYLLRQPDFDSALNTALSTDSQSIQFPAIRNNLSEAMRALNPQVGRATFNQFFLMLPDGSVKMASQPSWEGSSLADSQYFKTISTSNDQTFAVYNLPPLYNNQFVLITADQYRTSTGAPLGTLVGITEPQSLEDVLHGLTEFIPSSNAYFVSRDGKLIVTDQHTMQLTTLTPSQSQNAQLTPVFDAMMHGPQSAPRSVQFNNSKNLPVLA
jgi:hypothetical protein